jgi:hypothetical protein
MLTSMIRCAYCDRPATMRIVSYPEFVCLEHAVEFWTGLLGYARDRSEPLVEHEGLCSCQSCIDLSVSSRRAAAVEAATEESSASNRRVMAIAAAGPSPSEDERYPISLAS